MEDKPFLHIEPLTVTSMYMVQPQWNTWRPVVDGTWSWSNYIPEQAIHVKPVANGGYIVTDLGGSEHACENFDSLVRCLRGLLRTEEPKSPKKAK